MWLSFIGICAGFIEWASGIGQWLTVRSARKQGEAEYREPLENAETRAKIDDAADRASDADVDARLQRWKRPEG